jgi:hypothetical protein
MAAEAPAGEFLTEEDLHDPGRGAERDVHDPFAAADGLEPPDIHAGLLAWIATGAVAFVVVAMALLFGLYKLLLANGNPDPVHAFPAPRLETSINPRNMPATPEEGPAPLTLRQPSQEPRGDMARAMQAIVAKGSHAFDPLPPAAGDRTGARP